MQTKHTYVIPSWIPVQVVGRPFHDTWCSSTINVSVCERCKIPGKAFWRINSRVVVFSLLNLPSIFCFNNGIFFIPLACPYIFSKKPSNPYRIFFFRLWFCKVHYHITLSAMTNHLQSYIPHWSPGQLKYVHHSMYRHGIIQQSVSLGSNEKA